MESREGAARSWSIRQLDQQVLASRSSIFVYSSIFEVLERSWNDHVASFKNFAWCMGAGSKGMQDFYEGFRATARRPQPAALARCRSQHDREFVMQLLDAFDESQFVMQSRAVLVFKILLQKIQIVAANFQ